MSDRPWHKRYHSDALSGFIVLSLEERGAYQTLLDLMYDRGGPMPDNDGLLARYMGVSIRKWKSLRDSLISLNKIREQDGFLINERAIAEIENSSKTARKLAENGSKGGRKKSENAKKDNENNESAENLLHQKRSISEARDQNIEPSVLANSGSLFGQDCVGEDMPAKPKQPIEAAFRDWEKAAVEKDWPVPRQLTDQRRKKLGARLRAHGRDGWRTAITKAWNSPLLGGSEPPSWFTFDWLTKNDENLLKVLEGNYDRTGNGFGSGPAASSYAPTRDRSPAELEAARIRLAERGVPTQ